MFADDKVKINYILSQLQEGPAGYWAQAKTTQAKKSGRWGSYSDFLNEFTTAFISNSQENEAVTDLLDFKQTSTVTAYNAEFRSLAEEANVAEFRLLSRMYLRGLKDNITAAVLLQKPRATDMQTLYERAIDAETDMSINKSLNI